MTIASGVNKTFAVKAETTWGTEPDSSFGGTFVATGAKYLRRVTSNLNLVTTNFESAEINSDAQVSDFRTGGRHVEGTLACELSGGSYQVMMEAMLRAVASEITGLTAQTVTVADETGDNSTITTSGSFMATGKFKAGMVLRATGLTGTSVGRNLYIVSIASETSMVVAPADGGAQLEEESGTTGCAFTGVGKRISVPSTGHTNVSFGIEEWHSDINLSRFYTGCKPTQMAIRLPATGMATVDFNLLGRNMAINTTQQYSSVAAASTSGIAAAPQGTVFVQGAAVGLITGMELTIVGGHSTGTVIGSVFTPDVFQGRVRGTGQMTVYLQDDTYLSYFADETEVEAAVLLNATSAANTHFTLIHLPRIKFGGGSVDDGEKGLIITMPFTIIKKGTATGYDSTTISIQDSLFT
jgi:hypothetical protein